MTTEQNQVEINCAVLIATIIFCSDKSLDSAEASKILQDLDLNYGPTARETAEAKIEKTLKRRLGMS